MRKIPKCMSTQHPDNVSPPFFSDSFILEGDTEVREAYYAYSLGCSEQMWDCEGKEVDEYVVKKLLSRYKDFFTDRKIGRDLFITLRVPNPGIERGEGKLLLETLESIPRSYDVARAFYNEDIAPIFEVILPMTSSSSDLKRVFNYYKKFVVGKQNQPLGEKEISVGEWIGEFHPAEISVIPLIEDKNSMANCAGILAGYLDGMNIEHQRVFLARSDPALNYGNAAALLYVKLALQSIHELGKNTSTSFYPILGCGSAPFRGALVPDRVYRCIEEYPSVHTYTVQSAFKYDYPESSVRNAISELNSFTSREPDFLEEAPVRAMADKLSKEYARQVTGLVPIINELSKFVPQRRRRKLHIGLFGYSRDVGSLKLPRAITFCCALYSLGLPPEILGLSALKRSEFDLLRDSYKMFDEDLRDALRFLNVHSLSLLSNDLRNLVHDFVKELDPEIDEEHVKLSSYILNDLRDGRHDNLQDNITAAARIRRFLG